MEKVGSPQRATADEVETAKVQSASTIYLDNNINIESYLWWAKRSRAAEKDFPAESVYTQVLDVVLRKIQPKPSPDAGLPDGEGPATAENGDNSYGVTESEWEQAQRAARTATWGSMFYLITTDILGPWSVPWSLAVSSLELPKQLDQTLRLAAYKDALAANGLGARPRPLHRFRRTGLLLGSAAMDLVYRPGFYSLPAAQLRRLGFPHLRSLGTRLGQYSPELPVLSQCRFVDYR